MTTATSTEEPLGPGAIVDSATGTESAESMPRRSLFSVAKTVFTNFKEHNGQIISAGIAFYATLALVPTLIALVSVYSLVIDPAEIANQFDEVAGDLDPASADLIESQIESAVSDAKSSGTVALAVGIILALYSASGAVQKLMLSIDLAYEAKEGRKGWQVRGLAYLLTAGAIIGVVAVTILLAVIPEVMKAVDLSGPTQTLINILRFPLLTFVLMFGMSVLYRYGPDRAPKTPWGNIGAIVGTVAFFIFTGLLALYFQFAGGMPASYGVLGGIAAIIIYFQLAAIAVILGAETNAVVEAVVATEEVTSDGDLPNTAKPISFATAIAGLAALFFLGRGA